MEDAIEGKVDLKMEVPGGEVSQVPRLLTYNCVLNQMSFRDFLQVPHREAAKVMGAYVTKYMGCSGSHS